MNFFHIKKFEIKIFLNKAVRNYRFTRKNTHLGENLSFLTADNDILSLEREYFYCLIWESVFFQIIFVKIYHVLLII